jgi:hypothetical protein
MLEWLKKLSETIPHLSLFSEPHLTIETIRMHAAVSMGHI